MDLSKVVWIEDFLGLGTPKNGYCVPCGWALSVAPNVGVTPLSRPYGEGTNGIWMLGLWGLPNSQVPEGQGPAIRLRYGGGYPWDTFDARHFSPRHNLNFEASLFLNRTDYLSVTVGLTGYNDPDQVLAALWGGVGPGWILQARNLPSGGVVNVSTGWSHTPGNPFRIGIRTDWPAQKAYMSINGVDMAEVNGNVLTSRPMCPELQMWSHLQSSGHWSAPTMYIDYVAVEQNRAPLNL